MGMPYVYENSSLQKRIKKPEGSDVRPPPVSLFISGVTVRQAYFFAASRALVMKAPASLRSPQPVTLTHLPGSRSL